MLRFLTAGESHGQALLGILEGVPAGLPISAQEINIQLRRRQAGYGRGPRMKIEADEVEILSGVRWGRSLGSPIALLIRNRDWPNWAQGMSPSGAHSGSIPAITRPRPGHAGLPGVLKYAQEDIRNVLERSSARETAMRVALGAVARKLLGTFGIKVGSFVLSIGGAAMELSQQALAEPQALERLSEEAEASEVRCPDREASERMKARIDQARAEGDSLGGQFLVFALGLPPGLGSHVHHDRRLDGRLAQAVMSVQAIKAVEVGLGTELAHRKGSESMDEILYEPHRGFFRRSNRMGGLEGGMTNGMPLILRASMKPIPTLKKPLRSVELRGKEAVEAAYERSDVCAVEAASVVAEAMVCLTLAEAFLEKFGGDSLKETERNYHAYLQTVREA